MATNDIDFGGKTINYAILAENNALLGDVANESTQNKLALLLDVLANLGVNIDPVTGRIRVTVDAGTLPAVTTVSTVTNMTQIGAVSANSLVLDTMQQNWAACIRGRIS